MDFLQSVGMAFVPLFVAIDAAGCVPIYLGLSKGLPPERMRRTVDQAALVSLAIAVVFALVGRELFRLLGIEVADFQIGGGLLLFGYALTDLLSTGRRVRRATPSIGIVPLATPLLAGPALLTTLILMVDQHGLAPALLAVAANLVLVWIALRFAGRLAAAKTREFLNGVSKVTMVLLAGIGVMMVRKGFLAHLEAALGR